MAATAYAALVSIMQIIDELQRHPRPPISLHKQQLQSLTEIVTSLQQFLEAYHYREETDPLEMRIADAAHAVEDVIESHIVDQILADREQNSSVDFYEAVQKVIDEMEHVRKEAMDVKQKMPSDYELPGAYSSTSAAAASSSLDGPEQYTTMLGFDDILIQLLDKLTSQGSRRHVISITGMGGMGKTTIAKNVYQHELVAEHFDFLAWVTVSQQYKIRKLLLKILEGEEQDLSLVAYEHELGHILHKKLTGRRYLIIMDDIWDIQVWDRLRVFLPDNNNGSRIMITTRLSNLARQIDDSHNMEMDTLDEDNSWKLFCKHVFGEEDCPLELHGIGKQIVEGCKGLPLSISVVGGLLAKSKQTKSKQTKQYWEHIAENLNSTVNLEGDKHCLHLLYMSYNHLPVHLKPYFLYMGVLSEIYKDFFPIFMVVAFLIGEGFVKPISGKSLEEAAKECVIELIERNLILVDKTDTLSNWMYKKCRIHDLLRDLCLRESQKQGFVYVVGERSLDNIPHSIDSIRRICVVENPLEVEVLPPILESASHLRSLLADSEGVGSLLPVSSRLLRVDLIHSLNEVVEKVNLRLILMELSDQYIDLSSVSRFWNLQMFWVVDEWSHVVTIPFEIWKMPQLRLISLEIPLSLPDPPSCQMDCNIVLENLHSLINVNNFKCSEEVVKRIPCIQLLDICYTEVEGSHDDGDYCLNNLGLLQQLEILAIKVQMQSQIVQNQIHDITFPRSLLMLQLSGTTLHWHDVTTKLGYLPLLQVLCLLRDSCLGANWETLEGQFCSLRFLSIIECGELEYWMTESTHFPRLKELHLGGLHKLKEIPSSIGDIPTLQLIKIEDCCHSVYCSAQRIKEEQEEFGNEDLQIKIVDDEYKSQREISLEDETENEDDLEDETENEDDLEDETENEEELEDETENEEELEDETENEEELEDETENEDDLEDETENEDQLEEAFEDLLKYLNIP